MTSDERELAIYCLKSYSDLHSEVCEECSKYPNCDHFQQDELSEKIIKELEKEQSILEDIKAEILEGVSNFAMESADTAYGLTVACAIIDKHLGKENKE